MLATLTTVSRSTNENVLICSILKTYSEREDQCLRGTELLANLGQHVVLIGCVEAGALAQRETESRGEGDIAAGVDECAGAEEQDVFDQRVLDADWETMDLESAG